MKSLRIEMFQSITEEAIMGILVFRESDQKCVYFNNLAAEILEIDRDNIDETLEITHLIPENQRKDSRNFELDMTQMQGLIRDVVMRKTNGAQFIADLGIRHIETKKGRELLLMFQDTTMQKKLQREVTLKQHEIHKAYKDLLEQNTQLKELDVAKDRFLALTTHELRTPLAAIVATAEVLDMKLYDTDEQRDEFIATVHEQGKQLMSLVNDILDYTKIQAGKTELYVSEMDLYSLISQEAQSFKNMAEQKKISIEVEKVDLPVMAFYDEMRLKEVVSNVVSNAIKFSAEGTRIRMYFKNIEADSVILAIEDQGPGIAENDISKVFQEFAILGNIQTHQKGTGLGMPISQKLMAQLGGELTLESEVGRGTTFFIKVPKEKVLPGENYRNRPADIDDLLSTV